MDTSAEKFVVYWEYAQTEILELGNRSVCLLSPFASWFICHYELSADNFVEFVELLSDFARN